MVEIDFNNWDCLLKLMKAYGKSKTLFIGESSLGEDMLISIFPDKIITETEQKNRWTRKNIYYKDCIVEELYEHL